MSYLLRLLLLLIPIDREIVLNCLRIEDYTTREIRQAMKSSQNFNISNVESTSHFSFETFGRIEKIVQSFGSLWENFQNGLTLSDIENFLFFILFARFIILAIRYNLKTSFYITCIGLFAGYLWYRHLIDLISIYRSVLLKLPSLHKLGINAVQLGSMNRQIFLNDLKLEDDNAHWYNPGQVLYSAFIKGIINVDSETGIKYYIDPISMIISNIQKSVNLNILPLYYKVYNQIIPKIYYVCNKLWNQLSGVAAYAIITRMGKRYCPYLIRWHWTFLLIIGMIEQIFVYFIYRVYYFQTFVLVPQAIIYDSSDNPNLILQINCLNGVLTCLVLAHIGFILFGLFHAIWGQYFYMPFFVKNTELHIGPRPKNSIYSGGHTSWQDQEEKGKSSNSFLSKFWYGWFGNRTKSNWQIVNQLKKLLQKVLKKIKNNFDDRLT